MPYWAARWRSRDAFGPPEGQQPTWCGWSRSAVSSPPPDRADAGRPGKEAEALQQTAEAGLVGRVRLLLDRRVDPNETDTHPLNTGHRQYEGAMLYGNLEVAELLVAAGADTTTVDPLTRFVDACLAPDRAAVEAPQADPELLTRALERHPDLVARAARPADPRPCADRRPRLRRQRRAPHHRPARGRPAG